MQLRGRSPRTKVLFVDASRLLLPDPIKDLSCIFSGAHPKSVEGFYEPSLLSSTRAPSDAASTLGDKHSDVMAQELSFLRERVAKLEGALQQMCGEFERFQELIPQAQDSPVRRTKRSLRQAPKLEVVLDDIQPNPGCADLCEAANMIEGIASEIAQDLDALLKVDLDEMHLTPNPSTHTNLSYLRTSGKASDISLACPVPPIANEYSPSSGNSAIQADQEDMQPCDHAIQDRARYGSDGELLKTSSGYNSIEYKPFPRFMSM